MADVGMPQAQGSSRVGVELDGRYTILSEIGRGGMSVVYLAHDRRLNKQWAVKEFKRTGDSALDSVFQESILSEAELMRRLDHPALPHIVDIIQEFGTIFIVMDFIPGNNLIQVMKERGKPLSEAEVKDIGIQLCSVLSYLHTPDGNRGPIVYRDMKPSNVIMNDDGTVRLIDLGIAREFVEGKQQDTKVSGTVAYGAPEQFEENVQTDWRADIYSLGKTLRHLSTGLLTPPNPLRSYGLSEGFSKVIEHCIQDDRERRYQSCREIAYDLENTDKLNKEFLDGMRAKTRRFRRLAIASLACLLVGVAGMLLSVRERSSTFEAYLSEGDNIALLEDSGADDPAYQDKVAAYTRAIGVDSSQAQPYRSILEAFIADDLFTSDEADAYYRLLEDRAQGACADYAGLCYDFANVYFNYTTNYAQASMWFQNALDAGGLSEEATANAQTYVAICDFRKNLESRDKLGNSGESEAFVEYWNSLVEACEAIESARVTPRSKLKLYELIVDACSSEAYTFPFMVGGLARKDLDGRIDYVKHQTIALGSQVASTLDRELRDYILLHCDGGEVDGVEQEGAHAVIARTYESVYGTQTQTGAASGVSGADRTGG